MRSRGREGGGGIAGEVTVDRPATVCILRGMIERKNITQPADWWLAFEAAAKAEGLSLSEWIGRACQSAIASRTRRTLSERPSTGRPAGKTDAVS